MSFIRWTGLILGIVAFIYTFQRFRSARIRRFDFVIGMLFAFALIVITINPDSINVLRDMLSLQSAQYGRLIALTIASNLLLWLLLFYTRFRWTDHTDQFDMLVRQLGLTSFESHYPEIKTLAPIVVIIPAYNEEENIGPVLKDIPKTLFKKKIQTLVIDDGSKDNTLDAAREGGALAVKSPINRGQGGALKIGFDIAKQYGAEIVVTMDADGQHIAGDIKGLIKPVIDDEYDFVIGSRILGEREKDSHIRKAGIHTFNSIIRLLSSVKVTDCSNGFRAFNVDALSRVLLRQDQFVAPELIIDAVKKGIRIGEAPVTVKRRLSGESKKGRDLTYAFYFARTVIKTWWR
ncbi:MAG: DUF2304 family protein [Thermodesulfobacteriota bacterium]